MIISIDAENAFHTIQHHFVIEILHKLGIDETYLNVIKAMHDKYTASAIVSGGKL